MAQFCIVRDGYVHEARVIDTAFSDVTVEGEIRKWLDREPNSKSFYVYPLDDSKRKTVRPKFSLEDL